MGAHKKYISENEQMIARRERQMMYYWRKKGIKVNSTAEVSSKMKDGVGGKIRVDDKVKEEIINRIKYRDMDATGSLERNVPGLSCGNKPFKLF